MWMETQTNWLEFLAPMDSGKRRRHDLAGAAFRPENFPIFRNGGRTMKKKTAILTALFAWVAAMPMVRAEVVHGQCNGSYDPPKHLIDDREYYGPKIVITKALSEFHEFTGKDGKRIRGRIKTHNPDAGVVTLALEDGTTCRVKLSFFSQADQAYIREWHLIKEFFTQLHCQISSTKKQGGVGEEYLIWRPEQNIVYDITLANRSRCNLTKLTVNYSIYYELDQPGNRGRVVKPGMKSGTLNIDTLAGGATAQVKTQPLVLPKGGLEYYKAHKVPIGRVKGISIRVYLPLTGGRKAMREFCMPNHLRTHYK